MATILIFLIIFFVFVAVNRFRERVGLECVNEGQAGDNVEDEVDDSQTGVYDNIDNVQQQRRRRSRRNLYFNGVVATAGTIHDDGAMSIPAAVGDSDAAASDADRTEAALNSMLTGDVDVRTTSVRRRGRCADRLTSNRVVGPSFVSSTRVQLGNSSGFEQHQQQQTQQQFPQPSQQPQQHSERLLSHSNFANVCCTEKLNNEVATLTTVEAKCVETAESELPWNGYDNVTELKEAIFSSAAAKMAAGSKTKSGVSVPTTVSSAGDDVQLSEKIPPSSSSRAIGERLVDVHRQRLSAAGRELTSTDHGVQTTTTTTTKAVVESSTTLTVSSGVSPETDATPTTSVDSAQTQDQIINAAAAATTVVSSDTAHDNSVINGGAQRNKKTVSLESENENSDERKVLTGKGRKQKNKDKPPIGKTGNAHSKKVDKKSETRKEKTEAAELAVISEQKDHVVSKTEQPVSKISFLKSLLTRSRSPSPKRGPSTNNNDRSVSPLSLGRDVAKRLSDPLKSSFKQTPPDAPVVKVSVKQRDKKKKRPSADVQKNQSNLTSDSKDKSDCKELTMVNSSSERIEDTLTSSSVEKVESSLTKQALDDCSETVQSFESENLTVGRNSVGCNTEQQETANTPPSSVSCQFMESAVVVTAVSTLPTSHVVGLVSSTSGVVQQSPERRRSATVITLRNAANQTAPTVPCNELRNPWLVNLKECGVRPSLDSFEGEKVFKKGTATTRLILPGFARSQQDFLTPCVSDLHSQALERLTTTKRKSPLERRDRHSAFTSPIYDAVYQEHPSTIYQSTTELTGNRYQASVTNSQRADDVGKAYSLQDLKLPGSTLQTSNVSSGAPTAGRMRMEHAIDDHDNTGYIVQGRGDCGRVPTISPKPTKTVTFRDEISTNRSSEDRRLESVRGLGKTETLSDQKISKDFTGASLPLPVSRTCTPVVGNVIADRCVKTTKSSSYSLPVSAHPSPAFHSGSVDLRALRDTITSCDLEELPKYLSDMYRQQKLERQREQELAVRDRERLENIDKMWKELESRLAVADSVCCSIANSAKAEPTEDAVSDTSRLNTQTLQRKPKQVRLLILFLNSCSVYLLSVLCAILLETKCY